MSFQHGPSESPVAHQFSAKASTKSRAKLQAAVEALERRIVLSSTFALHGAVLNATETDSGQYEVATIITLDPMAVAGDFVATVAWGADAPTAAAVEATSAPGTFVVKSFRSFAQQGKVQALVNITAGPMARRTKSRVLVADLPITGTASSLNGIAGQAINATVATFNDPDENGLPTDYVATILWGDRRKSRGTITGDLTDGFTVSSTHSYARSGVFATSVIIQERNPRGSRPVILTGSAQAATVVSTATQTIAGGAGATFSDGTNTLVVGAGLLSDGSPVTVTTLDLPDSAPLNPGVTTVGNGVKVTFTAPGAGAANTPRAAAIKPAVSSLIVDPSVTDGLGFSIQLPLSVTSETSTAPYITITRSDGSTSKLALIGSLDPTTNIEKFVLPAATIDSIRSADSTPIATIEAGVFTYQPSTTVSASLKYWNGTHFVDNTTAPLNPCAPTLVLIHGLHSSVDSAFSGSAEAIAARGGYTQIVGIDYLSWQDPATSGAQVASVFNQLEVAGVHEVDVEAHSLGVVVAMKAASLSNIKIDNMVFLGGPINGTPAAGVNTKAPGVDAALSWIINGDVKKFDTAFPEIATAPTNLVGPLLSALDVNSSELQQIRSDFQAARGTTNVITVSGGHANLPLLVLDSQLFPTLFGNEINDGIVPEDSALGQDSSGVRLLSNIRSQLSFPMLSHVDLESSPEVINGVGDIIQSLRPQLSINGAPVVSLSGQSDFAPISFSHVNTGHSITQFITVTNSESNGSTLSYRATSDDSWITINSEGTGQLSSGGSGNMSVTINAAGLAEGSHTGHIEICVPGFGPEVLVPIRVDVGRISGTDLVFVIDTTGSMGDYIDAAKASATQIINRISTDDPNARFGIILYQDTYQSQYLTKTLLPFTNNATAAVNALSTITITPSDGGDTPEAVFSGIEAAIHSSGGLGVWRGGAVQKELIVMGDAQPHDPEPTTGYTLANVSLDAFNADPIDINTVTLGNDSATASTFAAIAAANRGINKSASTSSDVVSALLSAIDTITDSVTPVAPGPVDPTGLVDTWTGAIANRHLLSSDASVRFDIQTRTLDTLTATLQVGNTRITGIFTGFITLGGKFSYSIVQGSTTVLISGVVRSNHLNLIGSVKIIENGAITQAGKFVLAPE